MKATLEDLKRYAYCPKFYEQAGPLPALHDTSTIDFTKLVTYLFRRDMETGFKQNWTVTEKRWSKIFFARFPETEEHLRAFNRSLIAIKKFHEWYLRQSVEVTAVNYTLESVVYDHQIAGDAPVLLAGSRGLTLIATLPLISSGLIQLDPAIRYLAMALDEEFKVEGIENVALIDYQLFHAESFIPSSRYYELAVLDFVGLMTSIHNGVSYPNTLSCYACPINMTCEVMKGDGG